MNAINKKKISNIKKKVKKIHLKKTTIFIILLDIMAISGLILINTNGFKNFWIPTAMTTMSHKYLAYTLYDEETVNEIMNNN